MKLFKKVLEKLGSFSKEFEESLDATTQEEREKYQKLLENHQKNQTTKVLIETAQVTPFYYLKSAEAITEQQSTAEGDTTTSIATEAFNKLIQEADSGLHEQSLEGKKFDADKLSYTLLPWKAVTEVVSILEFGKQKYGRDNWQKVPNAKERYLDACFRHLISYVTVETNDPESGRHHLAHAVCCLLFILWFDLKEDV